MEIAAKSDARRHFYPRDVVSAVYATATWLAGWLAGWVSVCHSGIVSIRLNLSENFFDHLVVPSLKILGPVAPIHNSKGNPFIGALNTRGVGKLAIFDGYRSLSHKQREIGRWLLWNVNR